MGLTIRTVELSTGITVPFVERGDPNGVPLLFLHGLSDSWRAWGLVLEQLSPAVRAIAPMQRGHGDATRLDAGYGLRDYADDAVALLDALGIDRAIVAGHSSHGLVAQRFAIDHPARALGVVPLCPPLSLQGERFRAFYDTKIAPLTDPVDPAFVRWFVEDVSGAVPEDFLAQQVAESLKMPARAWRAVFGAMLEDGVTDAERARIDVPAMVLWGDQDTVVPREDQAHLVAVLPDATLSVYEGIGHSPHWEAPARVARDIELFTARATAER